MIPKSFVVLEQLAGYNWNSVRKILIDFINKLREVNKLPSRDFLSDLIYNHYVALVRSKVASYESYFLNVLYALKHDREKDKEFLCFLSGGPCEGPSGNPKYPQFVK